MILAVADVVWTAAIVAIGSPIAALLVGQQMNKQRKAEKAEDVKQRRIEKDEDYARLEEVAKKAEEARIALVKENKVVADEAARQQEAVRVEAALQQKQVADVAAGAAQLLKDAQDRTTAGTDEVARLAEGKVEVGKAISSPTFRAVIISHPSGARHEVVLVSVPQEGQHILLRGADPTDQPMRVARVVHVEANGGSSSPSVVIVVCPPEKGEGPPKEVKKLQSEFTKS